MIKENPSIYFALHIKENSQDLFKRVNDAVERFTNCFIFVTDFPQHDLISKNSIEKSHLAMYITEGRADKELINNVDFLWLDETKENIYENLDFFLSYKKKIICCSPELFSTVTDKRDVSRFKNIIKSKNVFGVCTDFVNEML